MEKREVYTTLIDYFWLEFRGKREARKVLMLRHLFGVVVVSMN